MTFRQIAALAVLAAACSAGPAQTQAASTFDGAWSVTVDCPRADDGAKGYRKSFAAQVTDGMMKGQDGTLSISGPIKPGGDATLEAVGTIGDESNAINRAKRGSVYKYTVAAKFTDTKGSGRRMEGRTCNFNFAKQ